MTRSVVRPLLLASLVSAVLPLTASCTAKPDSTTPPATADEAIGDVTQRQANPDDETLPETSSPYDALPAESRSLLDQPFTGDFDQMVKRRLIRAGVVYNRTQYFIDRGVQRGRAYESVRLFEDEINKRLKTGKLRIHVAIVPLTRDQLFPALEQGRVDFIAAALTVTPERQQRAVFSSPTRADVSEQVVTKAGAPPVATPEDLSGRAVFVRRSSSYFDSLQALNASLKAAGKPPVAITEAPEALEDDDLLEMVNAGLVDITIVDDYMVEFWRQVFTSIQPQPAMVRTGGTIAVGVRKDNPKLLAAVNRWIKEYGPRTAFGNTMERRYLEDAGYVNDAASEAERRKFEAIVKYFQTYGGRYGVDPVMMAAQGYQESRLDQSVRSHVGAIGVMQVMPATGRDLKVGDITKLEANIHAGVKYFRFMMDRYYADEPMDELNKALMTFASYNAGPGRIRKLRAETARRGLDPNRWFGNVERVVSERIGRETVTYVSNIYKYYVAYKLALDQRQEREAARKSVGGR